MLRASRKDSRRRYSSLKNGEGIVIRRDTGMSSKGNAKDGAAGGGRHHSPNKGNLQDEMRKWQSLVGLEWEVRLREGLKCHAAA